MRIDIDSKHFIEVSPYWFGEINIDTIEKHYGAKYVGPFCAKTVSGGWSDQPIDVFYQPNPDRSKGHSHYFGLIYRNEVLYITGGDSAVESDMEVVIETTGQVLLSRYRHDYVVGTEGCFIDGGRDYTRRSLGGTVGTLKIVDGNYTLIGGEDNV